MKRLAYYLCGIVLLLVGIIPLSAQTQWKDTIVVSRDGSGDYRTLTEAMAVSYTHLTLPTNSLV